jgi:hypothetical protein
MKQTLCLVVLVGACGAIDAGAAEDTDEVLNRIVQDWEQRQTRISRVKYVLSGETLIPAGALNFLKTMMDEPPAGDVPAREYRYPQHIKLSLDLDNDRVRKDVKREIFSIPDVKYYADIAVTTYDGKRVYVFKPREKLAAAGRDLEKYAADLELQKSEGQNFFFHYVEYPIYWAHGLMMEMDVRSLRRPINRAIYKVHGEAEHEGRACVILRSAPQPRGKANYSEIWVDTARDSAVLRYVFYSNGEESTAYEIDYQETSHGWLPRSWVVSKYGDKQDGVRLLSESHRFEVTALEIEPQFHEDLFRVAQEPGMVVADAFAGRKYVKGKPGEPDVDVAELRLAGTKSGRDWNWIVWSNVVLVLVFGGGAWMYYRIKRRGEAGQT